MRKFNSRHGCLLALLVFLAVMAVLVWQPTDDPGQTSAISVVGFFALILIYVGSGVEWLTTRNRGKKKEKVWQE